MSLPGLPVLNYRVVASPNTLEFYWQAPINDGGRTITSYTLWCSSIPYSTVISPSTYYAKVSTLTNTTNYTFQLAATNIVGTGPFNNYQIAQPGSTPSGITNLAVSTINSTTANVVWAFSNNAGEATNKFFAISVYPSTSNATVSSFMMAAYSNQRSQLISNLSTTYYTFLVQSINDAGYSFPNVSTLKLILPSAPILVYLYATTYSGSGTWNDSSGNGKNATLEGGTITKNAAGNGIVLNGGTSWTFPNIGVSNSWTVSIWYKRTGSPTGTGASIITQIQVAGSGVPFSIWTQGLMAYNGTWYYGSQTPTYALNVWTNVVCTWDGTNLVTYQDSTSLGTSQLGVPLIDGGQPYRIGKSGYNNNYVVGEIGEVRIYGSPFTSGEVLNLYNTTAPSYISGPLVYLYATTYSGSGTWNDTSPNGKNATLSEGSIAKNAVGNGIVLNGSTCWTFSNIALGNSWSFSVWFKPTSIATWGTEACILTQIFSASRLASFAVALSNTASNIRTIIWNNNPGYSSNVQLTDGQWINYQVTWDSANIITYVNGAFTNSTALSITSLDSALAWRIGRRWDSADFVKGEIGEVRIYGSPLSAAQVSTLYTTTAPSYTT